jgi:hypothetical protein
MHPGWCQTLFCRIDKGITMVTHHFKVCDAAVQDDLVAERASISVILGVPDYRGDLGKFKIQVRFLGVIPY